MRERAVAKGGPVIELDDGWPYALAYWSKEGKIETVDVVPQALLDSIQAERDAEKARAEDQIRRKRHVQSLLNEARKEAAQWEGSFNGMVGVEKDLKARLSKYREALERAADDLGKAVNQFKSQHPEGRNWRIFEEKEALARQALEGSE